MDTYSPATRIRNGIILTLVGLGLTGVCVAAWFTWQDRYWIAQTGPTEITLEQLAALADPDELPSPWVKVTYEKGIYTGVEVVSVGAGKNHTEYEYILFQVGDRWMIATVAEDHQGKTLEGEIFHSSGLSDREAIAEIRKTKQHIHGGRLLPFEFRAETDFGESWTAFLWLCGGFGAAGLFLAGCGIFETLRARHESAIDDDDSFASRNSWDEETEVQVEEEVWR